MDIRKEWDSIYSEADLSSIPFGDLKPPLKLQKLAETLGKARVLDLGCGFGTTAIYLAKNGFSVTAIDVSKKAIEIASGLAKKENVKIDFVQCSAHDLPFTSGYFQLVVDIGCFHHLPKELMNDYVDSVRRVLAKNGTYFLECFSRLQEFSLTASDIRSRFSDFSIVSIEEQKNIGFQGDVYVNTAIMRKD